MMNYSPRCPLAAGLASFLAGKNNPIPIGLVGWSVGLPSVCVRSLGIIKYGSIDAI